MNLGERKGTAMTDLCGLRWRKASRSDGNNGACVELAYPGWVRDSKDPGGETLRVRLDGLLAVVKSGRLDL